MRKIGVLGGVITLCFLLTGCTENSADVQKKAKSDSYSAEQVITKAGKAFESLKSVSVDLEITQYIRGDKPDTNQKVFSEIHTDLITGPTSFHQASSMKNTVSGHPQKSEAYYTEEGMFLNDGTQWKKVPEEQAAAAVASTMQMNPAAELDKAEGLRDILSMAKNSEEYIVTLKAAGDRHREELKNFIMASMPPEVQKNKELLENMNIKNFNYELAVNKESFLPSRFSAKAELELSIASNSVTMEQEMEGNYSNYNGLKEISVPDSIRKLAGE